MNTRNDELSNACWIPISIRKRSGQRLAEWLFTGRASYNEPFFEETIARCRSHRFNSSPFVSSSTLACISAAASSVESLTPTIFIFHVSRCGSTLLSQLLALDDSHIVLSEVPLFEQILRAPDLDVTERDDLLKSAITLYAQRRSGIEQRLFIKLDAWHLYDAERFRRLFPESPFIVLYREPIEVMHSHRQLRGMHMVPGLVPHPIIADEVTSTNLDAFTAAVLRCYYQTGLRLCQSDAATFAINYNEGILEGLLRICGHIGLEFAPELVQCMNERAKTHSKYPGKTFKPRQIEMEADLAACLAVKQAYEELEAFRLG